MSEEQTDAVEEQPTAQPISPEIINAPAIAIKGQQALGVPNIVTQTGLTDPDKVEMLYDPVQFTVKDEELRTTEDKLIQVPSVTAPEDISEVQETFVTPEEASLVNNIERTY